MSGANSCVTKMSKVQLELCQITFDHLLETGCWPNSRQLQVAFRKLGDLWDVAEGIDWRTLRVGEKYQDNSIVELSVEGVSLCNGSEDSLKVFIKTLNVLVGFYIDNPTTPKVSFEDVSNSLDCDGQLIAVACVLLSREPRLLSSHSIQPDGKRTDFKLNPDILRFEQIESIDDYLQIIQDERKPMNEVSAELNDVLRSFPEMPTGESSERLSSILTKIVDDGELRAIILQDIEEIHFALKNRMWKCVCLLSGSTCEGLLLSVLGSNEFFKENDKKKADRSYGLSMLIQQAIKAGILNRRVAKLVDFVRDSRNVIHPDKAMKDGIVDQSTARASYVLLEIICESIYKHRFG